MTLQWIFRPGLSICLVNNLYSVVKVPFCSVNVNAIPLFEKPFVQIQGLTLCGSPTGTCFPLDNVLSTSLA